MLSIQEYEDAIVAALQLEVDADRLQEWAEAYQTLLQSLTVDRARGLRHKTSAALRGNGMDAVRGLVHGGKTFRIAASLLHAYPAPEGPMIEIGAGWGPFALDAAGQAHQPIMLIEKSKRMLAYAQKAFAAAAYAPPKTIARDLKESITYRNYSAFAAPFVLNDLLFDLHDGEKDAAALRYLRRWMGCLRKGGRLYLLEPGTQEAARLVHRLRDQLKQDYRIIGPCTHTAACPMNDRPRDWCHFTLRLPTGPLARRIAELASRRFQEVHFSWLVLENNKPEARDLKTHRVLDVRRNDKNKLKLVTCSEAGHHHLVAQKRDKDVFRAIKDHQPGDVVRIDLEQLVQKGVGYHLENGSIPSVQERLIGIDGL